MQREKKESEDEAEGDERGTDGDEVVVYGANNAPYNATPSFTVAISDRTASLSVGIPSLGTYAIVKCTVLVSLTVTTMDESGHHDVPNAASTAAALEPLTPKALVIEAVTTADVVVDLSHASLAALPLADQPAAHALQVGPV